MKPVCGCLICLPCPLNGISCLKISLPSPAENKDFSGVMIAHRTVVVKPNTSPILDPDSGFIEAAYPLFSPRAIIVFWSGDQIISFMIPPITKCSLWLTNLPSMNLTIVTFPFSSPNATLTPSPLKLTHVIRSRLAVYTALVISGFERPLAIKLHLTP